MPESTAIALWWKRLIRRLRRALGLSRAGRSLHILEQWHGDGMSVYRIADQNMPGLVDLWRLDRRQERKQFFLCVINEAVLREDIGQAGRCDRCNGCDSPKKSFKPPPGNQIESTLLESIISQAKAQRHIYSTHLWVTGWQSTVNGVDRKGRAYQTQRIESVQVLAISLQSVSEMLYPDRHARLFAYSVVKRLAANEFREFHQHRTWIAAVKSIDWLQWLTGLAHKHISQTHVLQPPRYKKNRPG